MIITIKKTEWGDKQVFMANVTKTAASWTKLANEFVNRGMTLRQICFDEDGVSYMTTDEDNGDMTFIVGNDDFEMLNHGEIVQIESRNW